MLYDIRMFVICVSFGLLCGTIGGLITGYIVGYIIKFFQWIKNNWRANRA